MPNPKTPTALKIVRGTDQPCRRNENEPQVVALRDIPKPPRDLPAAGKKAWVELAQKLVDSGVMTDVDLMAFGALVSCYVEWKTCRDFCFKNGYVFEEKQVIEVDGEPQVITTGWRRYPQAVNLNAAEVRLKQWLNQFGMTPSSRAGIAAARSGEQSSPWDNF
jgi:P27 family predicted phage terminase small subunit